MPSKNFLNEDQKDCLQELMNISYGSATAAIADIIGKFANLSIPSIKTLSSDDFKDYIENEIEDYEICYIVSQVLGGNMSGENLYLIDNKSLGNLAIEFGEDIIDEDTLKDVVLEIGNIISSTTSGKLAELIETDMLFNPPNVEIIDSVDNLDSHYEIEYNHVIVISTLIEFEDQDIKSQLIMLLRDDSITHLKQSLDKVLEEF